MAAPKGNQYALGGPGGPGNPTKWHPEMALQAKNFALLGYSDAEIAAEFGISPETINTWVDPKHSSYRHEIDTALKRGRGLALGEVARSQYERALGYSKVLKKTTISIDKDGKELVTVTEQEVFIPPDNQAAALVLCNRAPGKWRGVGSTRDTASEDLSKDPRSLAEKIADAQRQMQEVTLVITDPALGTAEVSSGTGSVTDEPTPV